MSAIRIFKINIILNLFILVNTNCYIPIPTIEVVHLRRVMVLAASDILLLYEQPLQGML